MFVSKEGAKSAMAFAVAGLVSALVGNWALGTITRFVPSNNPLVGALVVGVVGAILLSKENKMFKIVGGALVLTAVFNASPAVLAMVKL